MDTMLHMMKTRVFICLQGAFSTTRRLYIVHNGPLNWPLTFMTLHFQVKAPQFDSTGDRGENQIWLSLSDPFSFCFGGGCPTELYGGPRPLWALRGSKICERDLTRPPGSPPRAQECSSENLAVQQQHAAMSLTNDGCMAAAMCSRGRAGFLLTRNCLTERQVRGVRARQIS